MNQKTCPSCQKSFPIHLLSQMVIIDQQGFKYELICPICALRERNTLHGLPQTASFQKGTKAHEMYKEAKKFLKATKQ